jgi:hypothetical protein
MEFHLFVSIFNYKFLLEKYEYEYDFFLYKKKKRKEKIN